MLAPFALVLRIMLQQKSGSQLYLLVPLWPSLGLEVFISVGIPEELRILFGFSQKEHVGFQSSVGIIKQDLDVWTGTTGSDVLTGTTESTASIFYTVFVHICFA